MHPEEIPANSLRPGQVGYIACNMKQSSEGGRQFTFDRPNCRLIDRSAHVGDTLYRVGHLVDPMPGFKPTQAMVRSQRRFQSCPAKYPNS